MKRLKLLHCADLHLEASFTSLGSAEKADIRRQEFRDCFRRIVTVAAEEKADLLLICGDLYEHGYTEKPAILFIAAEFERIPHIRVVIIPGNHDPYTGNSWYKSFQWPDNVVILAGDSSFAMFEDIHTRVYSQAGMPEIPQRSGRLEREKHREEDFRLLLLHGTLDMGFSKNAWNPFESRDLDLLDLDYVAFGHFHSHRSGAGRTGNIYNPGSPEPTGFDETGHHGVFICTLEEKETGEKIREVRFLQTNSRNYRKLAVRLDGCLTQEQVSGKVLEAVRKAGSGEDLFEIRLKGFTDENLTPDTGFLAKCLENEVWFARVMDESLPGYDFEAVAGEPGLRGLFTRKMLERIGNAASEPERQNAERALVYGLQAIDGKRLQVEI